MRPPTEDTPERHRRPPESWVWGKQIISHTRARPASAASASRVEVLAGYGIAATVCQRIPLEDGIQGLRGLVPTCWFDREKCRAGLEALCTYRRDYGPPAQELRARPLDGRTRHYAEAFRYFAVGYREVPAALRRPLPRRDNGWVVWPWRK